MTLEREGAASMQAHSGFVCYETPDPSHAHLILTIFKNKNWFHLCLALAIPRVMPLYCVSNLAVSGS